MASPGWERESLNIQLLVDSIPALIHTARPDGYLDYFNKPWLDYLGTTLEQVSGWNWRDFIHPEERDGIVARWRECLASGEVFEYETRVRRRNGEYRWMFHRKVPLRDGEGKIVKWYGSSMDVDERKQAELYLAEGQRIAHIGSWAFHGGGFDYWSPELFRIHGLDEHGTAPSMEQYLALVHPEDKVWVEQEINQMLDQDRACDFTKRIVMPDGAVRSVRCVGVPYHDAGSRRFFGTGMDVTEQDKLTEDLRRSEAYLTEAQTLSHTGSFGWKLGGGEIVWSDETYRIFEYDRSHKPSIESVLERIHPADRSDSLKVLDDALKHGKDFEHTFRLLMPDGRVKHVHALHAVQKASGNPEFVGAVTDITARKSAEDNIREQEMELRQMLDLAPQLMAVFGPNWERIYLNRIAIDYLGVNLDDWRNRGLKPEDCHPDDVPQLEASMRLGFSNHQPFELELRLRKADGGYRWFLARYNAVHDHNHQVRRWYVACTDIEDRKVAEERLRRENVALREEIDKTSMFEEIVGASPALQTVLSRISKVAPSDSTVLITGETGTGKELVARAIHRRSHRASRAFVSVNCAAIPRELIASELFGHEKGAFTGATHQRLGRFELANGGTIFLDEVGELPSETQIALLRVLQSHEFERVGGARPIHADIRVIAATNRDLQAGITAGTFRSDLFYRLHVFPIEIPPLRERRADISLLVEYFIDRYARKAGKTIRNLDKKTLQLLQSYSWPGNIRELQNVIERAIILCDTEIFSIDASWLPHPSPGMEPKNETELPVSVSAHEKKMIEAALNECRGRVAGSNGAAAKLGVPRSTLESKIRSLKIDKHRFRANSEN